MLAVGSEVGAALAAVEVQDARGAAHPLGALWRGAPALLVFVRHFACAGCSEHVTELSPRLFELEALGVRAALVGSGTPPQLAGFVARHALADKPIAPYTDPSLAAYREAGLERSAWGTMGPVGVWQLLRAWGRGHVNGAAEGDLTQQGGTLLVDPRGVLAFYHRGRSLGDHAPAVDVVDAALRLCAAEKKLAW